MFGRSFSPDAEIYKKTARMTAKMGADREKLRAALALKERGYPSADFLLGTIYEFGGPHFPIDLEKATYYYRHSVHALRDSVSIVYLARASMKRGHAHYNDAHQWLLELEEIEVTASTHLAWAWYYETSPTPDLQLARQRYVRAALRGRFWGFLGYSRVSRRMGERGRALGCDCLRVLVGPFLFLLLGARTQYTF